MLAGYNPPTTQVQKSAAKIYSKRNAPRHTPGRQEKRRKEEARSRNGGKGEKRPVAPESATNNAADSWRPRRVASG